MSQVLKSLQLVTQSYSGTPSTGTGALFASGSTLYFENAASTTFPLGSSGGSGGYIIVREYTGSAPGGGNLTYNWTNNPSIKYIQVICVGAGGGGGGNNARNAAVNMRGGSGGGGGAIAWGFFDSASLTQPSYTISIGAGGAGGAAVAVLTNTGNNGSAGGYTTFGGTMVSASGGSGGAGANNSAGTSTAAAGGLAINCLPGPGFAINGGPGAVGSTAINSSTSSSFSTPLVPIGTSGGGASWSIAADGSVRSGSLGGDGFEWNTLKPNNNTSSNSGSNNLVNAVVLLQFTSSILTTTYGLGGGGNGALTTVGTFNVSGSGGNGGLYGAGGGGSSPLYSATTGRFGFPGGSGSSGLCIVVEYY